MYDQLLDFYYYPNTTPSKGGEDTVPSSIFSMLMSYTRIYSYKHKGFLLVVIFKLYKYLFDIIVIVHVKLEYNSYNYIYLISGDNNVHPEDLIS